MVTLFHGVLFRCTLTVSLAFLADKFFHCPDCVVPLYYDAFLHVYTYIVPQLDSFVRFLNVQVFHSFLHCFCFQRFMPKLNGFPDNLFCKPPKLILLYCSQMQFLRNVCNLFFHTFLFYLLCPFRFLFRNFCHEIL